MLKSSMTTEKRGVSMESTNLQNLRIILEHYMPKTIGIVTFEEYLSITSILYLERMEVIDLRNLLDFVASFLLKANGDKTGMVGTDRMSAITAVIDEEIIRRGGTMDGVRILHLKYIGRDLRDRPVYRDDEGILWKDVDPRADKRAYLCTSADNEFDGEPDTGMENFEKYRNVTLVFIPVRDVW